MDNICCKKTLVLGIIVMFLIVGINPSSAINPIKEYIVTLNNGKTLYVGGNGPGNYTSIQAAIDDAISGDTVFVYSYSSPYFENIVIRKSINLIGEDKDTTVIDGSNRGFVVEITSDFVNISGFSIINSGRGINIIKSQSCNIKYNKLYNHTEGICSFNYFDYGYNTYFENNFSKCSQGLYIIESNKDHIINNTFKNCSGGCMLLRWITNSEIIGNIMEDCGAGIELCDLSTNNLICKNIINNTYRTRGIRIGSNFGVICYDNIITNNTVSNCKLDGIYVAAKSEASTVSGNMIYENERFGIYFMNSESNHVIGNSIFSNNQGGLHLEYYSNNNIVSKNYINNNTGKGGIIMTYYSDKNQILLNQIENNIIGININNSKLNEIKNNNIMKNKKHDAIFYGLLLTWNNKWINNYWSKAKIFPKIIIGRIGPQRNIPWFNFDWRPAKEPYDVGV